jgi:hypothetical protein
VIFNGMGKFCGEILLSGNYCHLIKSHCQGNFDENLSCCLLENFNSDHSSVMNTNNVFFHLFI